MKRPGLLVWSVFSVLLAAPGPLGAEYYLPYEASTGRASGMRIDSRLALGVPVITFISRRGARDVAKGPHFAHHCVATLAEDGRVAARHAILPRRLKPEAICPAREVAPDVVITVEAVRAATGGYIAHYGTGKAVLHSVKGQMARRCKRLKRTFDQEA